MNVGAGLHPLYTVDNGQTRWWSLKLLITHVAGTGGAVATLKVNGQDIPDQNLRGYAQVNPGEKRSTSVDARLSNGDDLSLQVDGADTIDVLFSACVHPVEQEVG